MLTITVPVGVLFGGLLGFVWMIATGASLPKAIALPGAGMIAGTYLINCLH